MCWNRDSRHIYIAAIVCVCNVEWLYHQIDKESAESLSLFLWIVYSSKYLDRSQLGLSRSLNWKNEEWKRSSPLLQIHQDVPIRVAIQTQVTQCARVTRNKLLDRKSRMEKTRGQEYNSSSLLLLMYTCRTVFDCLWCVASPVDTEHLFPDIFELILRVFVSIWEEYVLRETRMLPLRT